MRHGLGLGTRLFYPTYFKRNAVKFWLVFADKWATPTAVAKYPRNASKEQKDKIWRKFPELEKKFNRSAEAGVVVSLVNAGFVPTRE
ncbi:hypothetical protein J5X98_01080 [Leptothermofonsia sichuanensis E412]|uniref:DUF935 domain-containing protein n=1 Tax=Leptothermofonsia sichuanensis TaxID=2917832 RepID=UPI001CA68BA6|nr:DUF935 domain-containing protein [Leptothermofonsia sichuanensis]QZZ21132.1 hypothetical protein J5X98_01080 [Leptothermofonsia sichuanensis E412]